MFPPYPNNVPAQNDDRSTGTGGGPMFPAYANYSGAQDHDSMAGVGQTYAPYGNYHFPPEAGYTSQGPRFLPQPQYFAAQQWQYPAPSPYTSLPIPMSQQLMFPQDGYHEAASSHLPHHPPRPYLQPQVQQYHPALYHTSWAPVPYTPAFASPSHNNHSTSHADPSSFYNNHHSTARDASKSQRFMPPETVSQPAISRPPPEHGTTKPLAASPVGHPGAGGIENEAPNTGALTDVSAHTVSAIPLVSRHTPAAPQLLDSLPAQFTPPRCSEATDSVSPANLSKTNGALQPGSAPAGTSSPATCSFNHPQGPSPSAHAPQSPSYLQSPSRSGGKSWRGPGHSNVVPFKGPGAGRGVRPTGPGPSPFGELPPTDYRDVSADMRPVLLFDLNGTLTSHTSKRRSAGRNVMRPGTVHLRRLLDKFRLGVFTSSTLRTVQHGVALLEAAAGPGPALFSDQRLILHRDHTMQAPDSHKWGGGGKAWDTIKPLSPFFQRLGRVLLFDDDAYKAVAGEEGNMVLVPCWLEEDMGDGVVEAMVDAVLALLGDLRADADLRLHSAALSNLIRERAGLSQPEAAACGCGTAAGAAAGSAGDAGSMDEGTVGGQEGVQALERVAVGAN